jgi:histidyl-tRNA synthetase
MADKPKKPQKLKARLPRGLADRGPAEIAATRAMVEKIREVFERYGFEPVETPAMEYTDALGKFLPDQDRPNEGVFSFQDDDEQWISLRYDLTAPLARYVAENFDSLPKPYRSYRAGYVYRMQFDADTVGSASPAADAEMCMMAADTMEALGIPRGSYVVKVNNRKVLDGVMESIGLGGEENAGRRLTVLRAIDKADKFPLPELKKLLGEGRWDGGAPGKGDFTKGAGLSDKDITTVLNVVGGAADAWISPKPGFSPPTDDEANVSGQVLFADKGPKYDEARTKEFYLDQDELLNLLHHYVRDSAIGVEGVSELRNLLSLFRASGYGSKRIQISSSVVRGLEYYTGPVYEIELAAEDDDHKPIRYGSVGGGGRYDGLVSRFRAEPVPATGFSIGISRLQAVLQLIGELDVKKEFGPVVVTVLDRDRIADYQKMVAVLRNSPIDPNKPSGPRIRAELYLGNPKNMGNQLKYADRRNSPCVIIQGGDEKARGDVVIKDLIMGTEAALFHGAVGTSRADYLEERPAQFSCKEEELVAKVREVLARHDVKWG